MKSTIKFLLLLFCTLSALYLSRHCFTISNIRVLADIQSENDFNVQIFYTEKDGQQFNQKQSVKQLIKTGNSHIEIALPVKHIRTFRFDFGSQPGTVTLTNLTLKGNKKIVLDFNNVKFNQLDAYEILPNGIKITSNQNDPFVSFNDKFNIKTWRNVNDWCILLMLLCFYWFAFSKILEYILKLKILQNSSHIDTLFLAIFFGLLFVPMLHIMDAERSEEECRTLAKKPQLLHDGKIDNNFGTKFNDWYGDRFFGRNILLSLHRQITNLLAFNAGNDKVLVGKDGWLFYIPNNSINNFANISELSEKDMANALRYLQEFDDWCKRHNKKFYYLILPDKNKIYGEFYANIKQVRSNDYSIGHQFKNYIEKHSNVKVIYPYDELINHKKDGLLYFKLDTHWSPLGAYIGYQHLMKSMGLKPTEYNFDLQISGENGDLNRMVSHAYTDTYPYKSTLAQTNHCSKKGNIVQCTNSEASTRLWSIRDSFFNRLYKYMVPNFQKITLHDWKQVSTEDLAFIKDNADIIIIETVERFIPRLFVQKFPNLPKED